MKTIAFVNSKGGTGKSTLAAAIGVAAEASGEKVFMIDLDPQGSLSAWGERRKADTPAVDRIAPDQLPAAIAGLADASRALSLLGVLAPVMVQRMEHVDAVGLGLGVTELGGKAADETNALWIWIKQRISINEQTQAVA